MTYLVDSDILVQIKGGVWVVLIEHDYVAKKNYLLKDSMWKKICRYNTSPTNIRTVSFLQVSHS